MNSLDRSTISSMSSTSLQFISIVKEFSFKIITIALKTVNYELLVRIIDGPATFRLKKNTLQGVHECWTVRDQF